MTSRGRERRHKAALRAQAREKRRTKKRVRRRIVRSFLIGFGVLGALAIVLSLVLPGSFARQSGSAADSAQGIPVEIQVQEQIEVGQDHPSYNTTPPTSGWYYQVPAENISWEVREEPSEDEVQVYYLRRGGIMVQYNCPEGCPELVRDLERVTSRYTQGVILAPYLNMDSTIAMTAWGWIDLFNEFDGIRIEEFITKHIDQGPEPLL